MYMCMHECMNVNVWMQEVVSTQSFIFKLFCIHKFFVSVIDEVEICAVLFQILGKIIYLPSTV